MTANQLLKLRNRQTEIDTELERLKSVADSEARSFTPEETETINAYCDERDENIRQQELHTRLAATSARQTDEGQRKAANAPSPVRITPVQTPLHTNRGGFHEFGDFLHAVMGAGMRGGQVDQRLLANAPTTYATEGAGPDGGFSIPPDYRTEIMELVQSEASLFARTDQQTSSSNTFSFPADETAPWSTSGIQAYWVGEGKQITESKPVLRQESITLHKLAVMVSVTEELAADSASLDRWIRSKAPAKISYEMDRVLVHGTGAGQPLGILNSPSLVTVAKESGQTADTVVVANLAKMWGRCYGPARQSAVWLMNQDVEPQLLQLVLATYNPVFLPPGGYSGSQYATLFGRPIITTQICETVGDVGDVILADFASYITISRAMRQDVSMHIYFDFDVMAFKFIVRLGGQPKWSTTLSSRDGSNTLSPFVVLADRT